MLPTKRKRDSICGLGAFTKPFTIKPCPNSPYDKPATFKPIRVIGRAQLPLTFLDTTTDDSFTLNRLFSASIPVLDDQNNVAGMGAAPRVLIARHEANKSLYAMERVQAHVFTMCRLAGWLKEKDVADLWDPLNLPVYPTLPKADISQLDGAQWWQHAAVHTTEPPAKRARFSMLRPKQRAVEPTADTQAADVSQVEQAPTFEEDTQPNHIADELPEIPVDQPSPQQQLDTLVQQYLDAVYMSKTSLAYFAKGPITRIRTAFTSPEEGAPQTYELAIFLRSMLLSHKASDKKYRDKLPDIIKTIPPGFFSDDELAIGSSKPKKSKKKMKLNREGVYPHEEDIVKRWWISEALNVEAHGEENTEQRIKRRIGDLRVREALAQMILILEIIALENLTTYKIPEEEDPTTTMDGETQEESQAKPKKRKKKLDDVKVLLDLLLDKLCIWQSVDQDGILDFDSKSAKQENGTNASGKDNSSDRLQSFCVEVIVPFYVGRLPEQARMINKKLGGPVHTSPPKRKAMKPPLTSRKSGEPKEPDAKKSRRTLGRVATDTAARTATRKPTPSLHRSATDSSLFTQIKREESEVPLAAVPFQRSPSNAARQSLSHFKHLKGRQIDLSAPSAAAAAKIQQKKRVEEDLKEAITALKKPNRGLAVGGYVDDLEKRGLGLSNKSKKTVNARKALKDIQVTATPRVGKRTKDVIEQTPSHIRNPFVREHRGDSPPSSSFCIPSSGIRPAPSVVPGTVRKMTGLHPRSTGIAETPTKVPDSETFSDLGDVRRAIFATPAKAFASSPPEKLPAILATPIKVVHPAADSPLRPSSQPTDNRQEQSIYDALGWNDDDDMF